LLQIQENYAMDAVQRDLNLILTQDQIDNGGLFIYTTLDPNVQSTAQQALETQLTKIEHQGNFNHPLRQIIIRRKTARILRCRIWKARWLQSITTAAGFARWSVAAIIHKANSIARCTANRQVGSAFKPLFTRWRFRKDCCRRIS